MAVGERMGMRLWVTRKGEVGIGMSLCLYVVFLLSGAFLALYQ